MSTKSLMCFLIVLFAVTGCSSRRGFNMGAGGAPEVVAPEDRALMQVRVFNQAPDVVFPATIAVMQDLGWRLDQVDQAAGIIRASNERRVEPLGPKEETITSYEWRRQAIKQRASEKDQWTRWDEMMIHIEKWGAGQTRQRVVISRCGSLPAMSYRAKVEGRDAMINAPAKEESVELALADVYDALFGKIRKFIDQRAQGVK